MKKKLTLLIFDATGTPVKQAVIPSLLMPMVLLLAVVAATAVYIGINDYLRLKAQAQRADHLQSDLILRNERVAQQERQLVAFAQQIDTMKTQLDDLHRFERKIRIIANLDSGDVGSSVFGVGGSDPQDLNAAVMIEQDYQELVREMHVDINEIDHVSLSQQDSFSNLFDRLKGKRNLLAATPSIRPVKGWVSSRFGYRESPFTGRREFHRGLDIATHAGTPILSPADGVITYVGKKRLMGNMLTIDHGFGMVTRYGHLKKSLKSKGERVKRGDTVAQVGNTGRSTGPHVHYEVRLNGVPVNPEKYFFN